MSKPAKIKEPRLYVNRERLSQILTMKPPTDEQRAVLVTGTSLKLPKTYEMFPTEPVKQVLRELGIAWSDKK